MVKLATRKVPKKARTFKEFYDFYSRSFFEIKFFQVESQYNLELGFLDFLLPKLNDIKGFIHYPSNESCTFQCENYHYQLTVTDQPKDEFDNTFDGYGNLKLKPGCKVIFTFNGDKYLIPNNIKFSKFIETIELREDFVRWLIDFVDTQPPFFHFVGKLTEKCFHNGVDFSLTHYTTDRNFRSKEWIELFDIYQQQYEEELESLSKNICYE